MPSIKEYPVLLKQYWMLIVTVFIICIACFIVNQYFYHYTIVFYLSNEIVFALISILLCCLGFKLAITDNRFFVINRFFNGLALYYINMLFIGLLGTAISLTPYSTIDKLLVRCDRWIGFSNTAILKNIYQYPLLADLLWLCYASLLIQLMLIPLLTCFSKNRKPFYEMLNLFQLTAIIGLLIYYFFPTTAPASQFHSPYFVFDENQTWNKFYDVHHAIITRVTGGGLVSFPSFHVIWGTIMTYGIRHLRWLFYPMLVLNLLMTIACVALGWHYLSDVFGSIIVFFAAYALLKLQTGVTKN